MALFWFLAGSLTALASLVVALPWLRSMPRLAALPALPWPASLAAAALVIVVLGYGWFGQLPGQPSGARSAAMTSAAPAAGTAGPAVSANAFGSAAKVFGDSVNATGAPAGSSGTPNGLAGSGPSPAMKSGAGAGSMDSAVASLESRLAKGGGSPDDWELLAKSFEFLGRPADAAKARARQLPDIKTGGGAAAGGATASVAGSAGVAPANATGIATPAGTAATVAVSGEVTLAPALGAKAAAGETLFIVAKSVDAPGMPVAVFRSSVGSWPLKFRLDDSQAMMPGRNLSSAGRVTVEARISQKGQPLPSTGDLQGSTGIINPADQKPLKILIDRVIS